MEKDRSTKIIAVVALMIAVIGLSVGFASFSSNLTIETQAHVAPEDNMHVIFSNINGAPTETTVTGTMNAAMQTAKTTLEDAGVTGDSLPSAATASIDNTNKKAPKITNLKGTFTAPGQSVEYKFFVYNEMNYAAYLTGITFDTSKYNCELGTGTDSTSGNAACKSIKVTVEVDGATATVVGDGSVTKTEWPTTTGDTKTLAATSGKEVTVTIEYPATGSTQTNGDLTVRLPDVILAYSSTAS